MHEHKAESALVLGKSLHKLGEVDTRCVASQRQHSDELRTGRGVEEEEERRRRGWRVSHTRGC